MKKKLGAIALVTLFAMFSPAGPAVLFPPCGGGAAEGGGGG